MKTVFLQLNVYIAEGGQLAVGVALSIGYQGAGLVFLSPKVYNVSGGSCAPVRDL